jgi:hypothetical protein
MYRNEKYTENSTIQTIQNKSTTTNGSSLIHITTNIKINILQKIKNPKF